MCHVAQLEICAKSNNKDMRKNKKSQNWSYWFTVGLIAQFLMAPNAAIMKVQVDLGDPLLINTFRGLFAAAVALPFIFMKIKTWNLRGFLFSLCAGICMSVASTSMVFALKYSDASYVVVLSLLSPISLVLFSQRFFKEKISRRGLTGITLAALGAFMIIVLPLVFAGDGISFQFYPLATAIMVLNLIFFPLGIIFLRLAHQAGVNQAANQGLSSIIVMLTSMAMLYAVGGSVGEVGSLSWLSWAGIAYSGIGVIFVARALSTVSYEHIGVAATSTLTYLGSLLAIVIPVVVLGEHLSAISITGGLMILIGVYMTQKHHIRHLPHILPVHH